MAIVGEPCNTDPHAKISALFMFMLLVVPPAVCTHALYTRIVTVQLSFLSDWSEHRIHPGDTTHTHKHTQSQMLSSGSPTNNTHRSPQVTLKTHP